MNGYRPIASIAKFGYWEELPDGFDKGQISAALIVRSMVAFHPYRLTVGSDVP